MKIVISCGPSYEPIDGARRLTNFSTGRLGITLANYFVDSGHEVVCLKGEGSTCCQLCRAQKLLTFGTNEDLSRLLEKVARDEPVDAVLHAAALCDYRVEKALTASGEAVSSPKFATRDGRLHLILAPAMKVLPELRTWFPAARIIGWKYELAGTRDDAFAKAWKQILDCLTDACILNGAAYGPGFALCAGDGQVQTCEDADKLCSALGTFLQRATDGGRRQ